MIMNLDVVWIVLQALSQSIRVWWCLWWLFQSFAVLAVSDRLYNSRLIFFIGIISASVSFEVDATGGGLRVEDDIAVERLDAARVMFGETYFGVAPSGL